MWEQYFFLALMAALSVAGRYMSPLTQLFIGFLTGLTAAKLWGLEPSPLPALLLMTLSAGGLLSAATRIWRRGGR